MSTVRPVESIESAPACDLCRANAKEQVESENTEFYVAPRRYWECALCGDHVCTRSSDTWCPDCQTEYNAFGQMLASDWRRNPSNWDSEIDDLEGYEMVHANDN